MDQAGGKGRGEVLDPVHEVIDENLGRLVEGVAIDGSSLGVCDSACINGEVGTSREVGKDSGFNNKKLKEEPEEVKGREKGDQENICDKLSGVEQGTSYNSENLVNEEVVETVVVIEPVSTEHVNGEDMKLEGKADESRLSLVSMKATKEVSETDNDSCVIDMKCSSRKGFYENSQGERICRICHLASGQAADATIVGNANSATSADLIQLGCACKDELGIAHIHCAEAWFKLKGDRNVNYFSVEQFRGSFVPCLFYWQRVAEYGNFFHVKLCEICGETAKNVLGVANNGFMEEWNERRFMDNDINPSRSFGGCWRGQPFCNFLMACLVIAFVLPWFFRVNMF